MQVIARERTLFSFKRARGGFIPLMGEVQMISGNELDILLKLVLAVVFGGLIGWERERDKRPAGLRTNILICLGACLFGVVGTLAFKDTGDISRVWQNVITGVGFLGAGAVFKDEHTVHGLTTAATIWAVAALGLAIAAGFYLLAIAAEVIILTVLMGLRRLEHHFSSQPPDITPHS